MRDFLECQAYVVHLRSEHQQIQDATGEIERELNSLDSSCEPAQVREHLRLLRTTLVEHFREEEQGGCLEEAVSCAPHLSAEVTKVEKQHASILALIDRLIERAADRVTDDFRESFRQFAKVLHAHETAEDRILHLAYGMDEFETEMSKSAYGE